MLQMPASPWRAEDVGPRPLVLDQLDLGRLLVGKDRPIERDALALREILRVYADAVSSRHAEDDQKAEQQRHDRHR